MRRSVIMTLSVLVTINLLHAQVTPSGGQSDRPVKPGSPTTIGWARLFDATTVDIFLWNALTSERLLVARNIPAAQGEYQWTVPATMVSGTRYRFIVEPTTERYRRILSGSWVTIGQASALKAVAEERAENAHQNESVEARVSIAPQPAQGIVRIQLQSEFQSLRIVALDGTQVISRPLLPGELTVHLDVQHLAVGPYQLVLTGDDGRCTTSMLHIMR